MMELEFAKFAIYLVKHVKILNYNARLVMMD